MSDPDDATLEDLDCEPLVQTELAQVAIVRALLPHINELPLSKRARFEAIMGRWCDGVRLTPEMFNANEGRSPGGILLQTFKGFKIRLYGFARTVSSKKTFLIVDVDPAKKQDKADQGILKRAKRRVDEIGKGN
jgi:hypothetical protein